MCQAVDSNFQWTDQDLSTASLDQAAFCWQRGAQGRVASMEGLPGTHDPGRLLSSPTNLYPFLSWGSYLLLRGRDPLLYLYIFYAVPGPGFSIVHSNRLMNVCWLRPTSYAVAWLLSTKRGKFTRCNFAKNIPLRGISCLVICNSSFPKLEECWKKSLSKWHFSTLKISAWV